jgi:choline dehydrogenase-like flavoprotein
MTLKSSFGLAVDWPITYAELEPFYCDAEYEIGVNGIADYDESGQGLGTPTPRSRPFPLPRSQALRHSALAAANCNQGLSHRRRPVVTYQQTL